MAFLRPFVCGIVDMPVHIDKRNVHMLSSGEVILAYT